MFEQMEPQPETAKDINYELENSDLNNNLVLDDKIRGDSNFRPGEAYMDKPGQNTYDENSLHLGEMLDKIPQNPQFKQKESEFARKIEDFVVSKMGNSEIKAKWDKIAFAFNYFLMLGTFLEFIFQRFDVPTLTLCFIIFFIKLGLFQKKHLYKWLFYLLFTVCLDVLVILDIFPVSLFFNLFLLNIN